MWTEIGASLFGSGLFLFGSYEFGKASARYTLKKNIKLLENNKDELKKHIEDHQKLLDEINRHFILF